MQYNKVCNSICRFVVQLLLPSRRNFLDLCESHDLKRPGQGGHVATRGYTTATGTRLSETILHQKYLFISASRSVSKIIKSATLGLSMIAEEQILSFNLNNHVNTNFSIKYKLEIKPASTFTTNNPFVRPSVWSVSLHVCLSINPCV